MSSVWNRNLSAAMDLSFLKSNNINFIVTVDSCPLPESITNMRDIHIKFIQVTDLESEDLLSHFDSTFQFIKDGIEKSSVLVHCYFGVSRSSTIVIAYLMKKYEISFGEAHKKVKCIKPNVSPNTGFLAQLSLYEILNWKINKDNLQYKMYRLKIAARKVKKVKILPQDCIDVIKKDPSLTSAKPDPKVFRCRKCRRILALQSNLLPHFANEKLSWKDSKLSTNFLESQLCSSTYFVEPLSWMSVTQSANGKINCPKCHSKLGSYSWTMGCQCQCGAKVSPAFYFIPSKVDHSGFLQNVQFTI
ncbi:dual specificity protein phosphatase MPK-4-like isoform X2 [Daktulosphaira vitifoliae]|uniref:dual specificity protein phosphatase MPK-4-like isoform X2 n=1 Tax=Daktulosphaira vitifoliae TaxID=58002 RepID=UPI0021AAFD74|nr:dual specificity protein phosphatase MPK-4-like isoform X2 [Daktulosphaira vitifoliae]